MEDCLNICTHTHEAYFSQDVSKYYMAQDERLLNMELNVSSESLIKNPHRVFVPWHAAPRLKSISLLKLAFPFQTDDDCMSNSEGLLARLQ